MIRRWTRVIELTIDTFFLNSFHFRYQFKSFKRSIIYRKFFVRYTKFRRKQISRLKHRYTWAPYVQIWQSWVRDFNSRSTLSKFYYMKNYHEYEIISYNSFHFNTKKSKLLFNSLFFINCYVAKKWYIYFQKLNIFSSFFEIFYLKNHFSHYSYNLTEDNIFNLLKETSSITPVFFNFENTLTSFDLWKEKELFFNFEHLEHFYFETQLNYFVEFYKIINLMWIRFILLSETN